MGRSRRPVLFYIGIVLACIVAYICLQRIQEGFEGPQLFDIPFHISRKRVDIPTVVSGVPLVFYQSWHSNKVPVKMKETIYKLLDMNPEFDYYLYSDEKSLEYIKEKYDNDVVDAFNTLKPGAYKSDLWRYCVLYKEGGVYLDIKFYSVVPLLNIIRDNPIIYVRDLPHPCGGIYNAFMASPPNNDIFKHCIDDIVNSCKLKLYKDTQLSITGPCLLGDMVKKYIEADHVQKLPFNIVWHWQDRNSDIHYNNEVIIKSYIEYRAEQSTFQKTMYYSDMWAAKDVYN